MSKTTKGRPQQPSDAEARERMAMEGDVDGLLGLLAGPSWGLVDQAEVFRLLLHAVDVAVRRDPLRFGRDMFGRMLGFSSYLLLRGQCYVASLLPGHDQYCGSHGGPPLPPHAMDWLPQLMKLQESVAAIVEAQARTVRLERLAGRRDAGDGQGVVAANAGDAQREAPASTRPAGGPSVTGRMEAGLNGTHVNVTAGEASHVQWAGGRPQFQPG